MEDKLVTIAKFSNYIEADLAKQTLDDFGINSVLTGQNTANVYAGTGIANAYLQTLESQAQEALEILNSQKKEES